MTRKVITGKEGISLDEARAIMRKNKIEKLPIISDGNELQGLICILSECTG